jgi:AcrR family transcriptional regulator
MLLPTGACRRDGSARTFGRALPAAAEKGSVPMIDSAEVERVKRPDRRALLLQAAVRHLESRSAASLRVGEIAEEAGVAVGLIKHYFGGRDGLVAAAQQARIAGVTELDIAGSRKALAGADDLDALMEGIRQVARHTIDRRRADVRLSRFDAIATAHGRPEARAVIGGTLSELIDAMAGLIADAQERGVVSSGRSPRGLATFIQAYSLGLLVHDLDLTPSDDEELLDIAMDAVRRIFSAD